MQEYHIVDRKCPLCGKNFIPAPEHRFREGNLIYCSWKCYNHREERKRKWCKRILMYADPNMTELLQEFRSASEAADYCEGITTSIYKACRTASHYAYGYWWCYK